MNERAQLLAGQTYEKIAGKPVSEFTRWDWDKVARELRLTFERQGENPDAAGESARRIAQHIAAGQTPDQAVISAVPDLPPEDRGRLAKLGWHQYLLELAERRRDQRA